MDEKTRIYEYWLAGISSLSDRKKIWLPTEIQECRSGILYRRNRDVSFGHTDGKRSEGTSGT